MRSFFVNIPKVQKDTNDLTVFISFFGSLLVKATHKHVGEINPRRQFHQHFTAAFCANIFAPKNYKAKCN